MEQPIDTQERKGRWLRRRVIFWPTWRLWLILFTLACAGILAFALGIYSFLAPTQPVRGGLLVVEGWAPDHVLRAAVKEFQDHRYKLIVVTGGQLEPDALLSEYRSYAGVGAARLIRFGVESNLVVAVHAARVDRNRTLQAALAFAEWKLKHHPKEKAHLWTVGAHARRSWFLFGQALGQRENLGITAVREKDYDPDRWWASSSGIKTVLGETLACLFAWLNHPAESAPD